MIQLVFLGVWACLVSLGAAFAVMTWQNSKVEHSAEAEPPKSMMLRTKTISVPMLAAGQVNGYVVARFELSADSEKLSSSGASPETLVADEAFKLIYSRDANDVRSAQKHDLQILTKNIADGVNKRLGSDLVKDVLIESWSYLSKEDLAKFNEQSKR